MSGRGEAKRRCDRAEGGEVAAAAATAATWGVLAAPVMAVPPSMAEVRVAAARTGGMPAPPETGAQGAERTCDLAAGTGATGTATVSVMIAVAPTAAALSEHGPRLLALGAGAAKTTAKSGREAEGRETCHRAVAVGGGRTGVMVGAVTTWAGSRSTTAAAAGTAGDRRLFALGLLEAATVESEAPRLLAAAASTTITTTTTAAGVLLATGLLQPDISVRVILIVIVVRRPCRRRCYGHRYTCTGLAAAATATRVR